MTNKFTTESAAKALAEARDSESQVNLFSEVKVTKTDDGSVIVVQKEEGGNVAYLTVDDSQVRTISYLWNISDIHNEKREALYLELLRESVSLPLIGFAAEGDEIVLHGSMATAYDVDALTEEVSAIFSATEIVMSQAEDFINI